MDIYVILKVYIIPWSIDSLNELNDRKDGKVIVRFYHSLCRLGLCKVCKKSHLELQAVELPDQVF